MGTGRDLKAVYCLVVALLVRMPSAVFGAVGTPIAPVVPRPSAGCRADSLERGGALFRAIVVGGVTRAYILDVPANLQPHVTSPLLFDFHGFGDSAARVSQVSQFHDLAARDGFITVYPDGLPVHLLGRDAPGWEISSTAGNRDLAFTTALLDQLEREHCIDRARVFATGFSNGGSFSHLLGCTMADRFAAIAPVSGGLLTTPCTPPRAVPVLIYHGRHDTLVDVQQAHKARDVWLGIDQCRQPFERTPGKAAPEDRHASDGCERLRQCRDGAEVEYCEHDGGHHWPADATERIWNFFRDHPMQSSVPVSQ